MSQTEFLYSIEEKRDQVINERNALLLHIHETGNTHKHQRYLSRLTGRIEAFNEILDEMRKAILLDTLEGWKNEI